MDRKLLSRLDTSKKKAGAIVLCIVLVAALGAGTVFAANSVNTLMVRMENGVRSFSTDDGKTWSQDVPGGATVVEEDGKITITRGVPPVDVEGDRLMIKVEDGVMYYSTDGGNSWSRNAPGGVTVEEDGSVVKKNGSVVK